MITIHPVKAEVLVGPTWSGLSIFSIQSSPDRDGVSSPDRDGVSSPDRDGVSSPDRDGVSSPD
ncbi:hypothetical protein RRG08_028043, partial [Elysia crispata]